MDPLLKKLNFKGDDRILLLNAPGEVEPIAAGWASTTRVDRQPAAGDPYGFLLAFVQNEDDVQRYGSVLIEHAADDAVLWFAYPKKSSKRYRAAITRDHGWQRLVDRGFEPVRQVAIDDDWSALRFRHVDHIPKTSLRFTRKEDPGSDA
ncbi:MAG TPA: hypothetical protein VF282_12175 [Bacillota bacterium]